jgi:outer membrane protein OmpA-like peptidoglycan-associated protein/Tol biopolymer transport system component
MKKFLSLCCFICIQHCFAQQQGYSSGNASATRIFEQALRFYDVKQTEKALDALKSAIEKDSTFVEAYSLQGNIYDDLRKYDLAIESYRKAILVKPDFFPNNYFFLGSDEFKTAQYDSAKKDIEKFLTYPSKNSKTTDRAKLILASCSFADSAMKNPVPFKPVNLGDSVNTSDNEYFPCITADSKTLLFSRFKIISQSGSHREREELVVSHFEKGHWTKAKSVEELNTIGNQGAASLTSDGQYIFYVGCEDKDGYNGGREKGEGSCDIYLSKKTGDKFGKPRNLGQPVNTSAWETQPSFSSDGRTLYFVRAVKGSDGRKQTDIFVTFIDDDSKWSEPVPLPDNINTPDDEQTVFIHPDNQTLYFASNGHIGMGGMDIYMSKRKPDGSWGDPVNLGYPINTSADETSLLVSAEGKTAYFASNREDSRGGLDLYQFDLYEGAQPERVTYMKGKVFDAETKAPLAASFELIDLATAKPVVRSSSNAGNGEFLVCLPAGKSYALNVSLDGYLFYSDNFMLKDSKSAKEPFLKDIPLKPIKAGQSIVLKNIFYETDKYNLKNESKAELGKVVDFMNNNPNVKVEISGHTDNTGTKLHNQQLSESRAKAVYDEIINSGISKERLTYKGYADTKPIASNNTEVGKGQNRRTEFLITEVK